MNTYTIKNILNNIRVTITENSRKTREYDILPEDLELHEITLERAGYINIEDIYTDRCDESWLVYDYCM